MLTSGEYLKKLFYDKDISITEAAKRIGVNRTVIYRLFSNSCTYSKTVELVDRLLNSVEFEIDEKKEILRLIKQNENGPFFIETRKILSNIYSKIKKSKVYVNVKDGRKTIDSILEKIEYDEAFMCFSNIDSIDFIESIGDFISNNPDITIYNYLNLRNHKIVTAYELLTIMKLSVNTNYIPFSHGRITYKGLQLLIKHKSKFKYLSVEYIEDEWYMLKTDISFDAYNGFVLKHKKIQDNCIKLKERIKNVDAYIHLLDVSLEIDYTDSFYNEGAPCFGYLTAEILMEMFSDVNYLNLPKKDPHVQELVGLIEKRRDIFYNENHTKKFLFDKEHIKNMMISGIVIDHPEEFKPMSMKQRKRFFEWMLDCSEKNPEKLQFKLLKKGTINYPYAYGTEQMFYTYCSETGYTNGFLTVIKNDGVDEIMRDFSEYIWNEYTISAEESRAEVKKLMDTYLI